MTNSQTTEQLRGRIAAAVHLAVREHTGGDGLGACLDYAVAGAALASRVFGNEYVPQAGSLLLSRTPARPTRCLLSTPAAAVWRG
jgi:hypothetical protein